MTDETHTPEPEVQPDAAQPEQPVQPEAPEPEAEPKRSSVSEAIEKAFKKDLTEPEPAETKPAEPKADEPKADAKPTEADKDAKPEGGEDGPARDPETGKFVSKDGKAEKEDAPDKKEEKPQLSEPPARFSPDAKAAWKDAPEPVRAEAHRMMRELEDGLQQKDEKLKPLEKFFDIADKHGVTVHDTLEKYVNMETNLRHAPQLALPQLVRNLGLTGQQAASILLGDGKSDPKDQEIANLRQTVNRLEQQVGGVTQNVQKQHEEAVVGQIQQFATNHPRFDELSTEIVKLLDTGYAASLEDAYEVAERLYPAPQPEPNPAPPAPAQTREVKSVTGAPGPGSNPAKRAPSKSPQEALKRAWNM